MWLADDMGSPGPETDVVSRVELGYSYELGSGQTRIRVLTRPRWGLGTVMTVGRSCNEGKTILHYARNPEKEVP